MVKFLESGVEFIVKDGKFLYNSVVVYVLILNGCCFEIVFIDCFLDIVVKMIILELMLSLVYVDVGYFCFVIG